MRKALLTCCALAALAGCGSRTALEPAPGQARPPAPAGAAQPLTPDQLLSQPPQARPERVDEVLTDSEERQDDRFDLPPD